MHCIYEWDEDDRMMKNQGWVLGVGIILRSRLCFDLHVKGYTYDAPGLEAGRIRQVSVGKEYILSRNLVLKSLSFQEIATAVKDCFPCLLPPRPFTHGPSRASDRGSALAAYGEALSIRL